MSVPTNKNMKVPGRHRDCQPGPVENPRKETNEMQTNGATLAAPIPHPGWCSPRFCVEDADGVTHCSEPTVVQLGGERIELRLTQTIFYHADLEPGPVETLVDATHMELELPSAQHEWPAGELRVLIAALAEVHHKALLLSGPVLAGAA